MNPLRVFLAVLAGYVLIAVLGLVITMATSAAFGVTTDSVAPPRYLLANIVLGMVAAAAGGYLCARLAPIGRVTIAAGLLLAVYLIVGVVSGRAAASATQPLWYQAVVTMLGASGLLVGAVIERAQDAERARRARSALVLALLLVLPVPAAAQGTVTAGGPDLTGVVKIGDSVSIAEAGGERTSGRIVALTRDAVTVQLRSGAQKILPAAGIGRVVVKDSKRNGMIIGAIIGGIGGIVGGIAFNSLCVNEGADCAGEVATLFAMGLGAGLGIGGGADALRQRTVYDGGLRLPGAFITETAFSVGGGRHGWDLGNFRSPVSVAGSWTYRHPSGPALELEAATDIGRSIRPVSCVQTFPGLAPAPVGPCLGTGFEGVGQTRAFSGKFVYYFPGARVKPYASIGFAEVHTEFNHVYADVFQGQVHIIQLVTDRFEPLAVGGGGVRLALTDRVSIRPDVTISFGGDQSMVRAAVGLGYRW